MNKTFFASLTALAAVFFFSFNWSNESVYPTIEIGSEMPMQKHVMLDVTNDKSVVYELFGENGTLFIFTSNTCPFVVAWEDRYPGLKAFADQNNIGFALINSNEKKRDGDDSFENMQKHAKAFGYGDAKYLLDTNSEFANALGAKTTPHVFLFNAENKLVYEGAIDDNYKSASEVEENYLINAIKSMVKGKAPKPATTKAVGCSIKRV